MEVYAGIDLHSSNSFVGIVDKDGQRLFGKRFPNSPNFILMALINLINNAKDAMVEAKTEDKVIVIKTTYDKDLVTLEISDPGIGIPRENLKKIFTHGFTTKIEGHGFGLHSSANYPVEMKGKIWATSPGIAKGTTMVIQFPVDEKSIKG